MSGILKLISAVLLVAFASTFILVDAMAAQAISPQAAKQRLVANPNAVLIDVRERGEYNSGHIKGAMLIPRGNISARIGRAVPNKKTEVILYCRSGRRSAAAADTLNQMGYRNVKSISGGISRWQSAGYKVQ